MTTAKQSSDNAEKQPSHVPLHIHTLTFRLNWTTKPSITNGFHVCHISLF